MAKTKIEEKQIKTKEKGTSNLPAP